MLLLFGKKNKRKEMKSSISERKKKVIALFIVLYIYIFLFGNLCFMEKSEEPEVEMEDASEDTTLVDIDSADAKNPLKVVGYVEEIYKTYRNIEVIFLLMIFKSRTLFTVLRMLVIGFRFLLIVDCLKLSASVLFHWVGCLI